MPKNPRNMRVRVDRENLIAAIERKANQCRKEYERKGSELERAVEKARKEQVAAWRNDARHARKDAKSYDAAAVELAKIPLAKLVELTDKESRYERRIRVTQNSVRGGRTFEFYPPEAREGTQLQGYDNILRMLRMSKEKSVSLTEEQFQAYMDGCPVNPGR